MLQRKFRSAIAVVASVVLAVGVGVAFGQTPLAPTPSATSPPSTTSAPSAPSELSKAAFLLGKWQGAGWIEFSPGRRAEFKQFETISLKLGSGAVVMEGLGTRKGADGNDIVTHEALGILTYDAAQKKAVMRAYRSGGQFVDADVTLNTNKLTWQFKLPNFGDTRYTIVLDDKGQWFEIGELSKDGVEWRKFFETTLARVAAP